MKKLLLPLLVIAVIAIGAIIMLRRPASALQAEPVVAAPSTPKAKPPPPPFVPPPRPVAETVAASEGGETGEVIHIYMPQVLATVNGTAITMKDLAGIPAAQHDAEQTLSRHMYEFLLDRAIERELVFQAAHAQGIQLNDEQKGQLAHIRTENEAGNAAVVDLTMSPERVELDERDAESRMLLANLATASGVPSPYVTPEMVQAYYTAHQQEFGEIPADTAEAQGAQRKIDVQIRQKLAAETTAAYQKGVDGIRSQLKSAATIQVTTPDSR